MQWAPSEELPAKERPAVSLLPECLAANEAINALD